MTSAAEKMPAPRQACWCCGSVYPFERLITLDERPEAVVCFRCAAYLSRRARARYDELNPSIGGRVRGSLWSVRRYVVSHGLHHKPVIGPFLRWLGRVLP